MTCHAPRCCKIPVTRDLYCWASSSARVPRPVSSITVPSTHSAAPGPVVPEPILTLAVPRTTAPGCPPGSRPTCSTTASVPTPASPRSASLGTSSTRAFISERMPGTCRDGIRAASMAAPTSGCDVSSGTTIPGSTTSSSTGSTGSVSVSLIDGLQSLSHTHSRKKSPQKFPLGVRPKRYAPGYRRTRPADRSGAAVLGLRASAQGCARLGHPAPRPRQRTLHDHEASLVCWDQKSSRSWRTPRSAAEFPWESAGRATNFTRWCAGSTPTSFWPSATSRLCEQHVQVARAVHALDPDELDVAGGGGTGDEGVRPGRVEPGERVRQVRGDLVLAHHDQVEVGHQGERAAALTQAVVQDDGPGLGDGDRAAGDDAAHPVEFGRGKRGLVADQRDLAGEFGQPSGGEPVWYHERAGRSGGPGGQHAGDGGGEAGFRDALHDGAVVGGAFGEEGGDVVRGGVVVGAQVPAGKRGVGSVGVAVRALAGRRAAAGRQAGGSVGGADPGQDLISGGVAHDRGSALSGGDDPPDPPRVLDH